MQSLEPKYCEDCGRSFLREVGSGERYCPAHRVGSEDGMSSLRVRNRLTEQLQSEIRRDFNSLRAYELADAIALLDAAGAR